jgi:AcrR family transcriptional regulator
MAVKSIRKSAGGRPRLLTQQQVVEAALRLGLERLTMKRVADDLGVSIATLYQYVIDRDELLRLAIMHMVATLRYPGDTGQHWSKFLRDYAEATRAQLAVDTHILVRFLHSGFGLESELLLLEKFLEVMTPRGFTPQQATRIMRQILTATMGAAMATCRERATIARSGSVDQAMHAALAHFTPDDLPLVRQTDLDYRDAADQLSDLIEPLIEKIAAERGEKLPKTRSKRAHA